METGKQVSKVVLGEKVSSPGQFKTEIDLDAQHSFVSMVTMISPSPDWFTAIQALNLLGEDGKWLMNKTVELDTFDAGTDDGPSFTSQDSPVTSEQNIELFKSPPLARKGKVTGMVNVQFSKID